jgi:hypothetical protein
VAAQGGDFIRRGHQRFQHQFYRQSGLTVEVFHHLLGVCLDLLQGVRAVQVLAADGEPDFALLECVHGDS